ncbi:hypothetical protein, partial [Actinoplanes philippinensis]|uniref:hypothetical protein n=1 Tax=Actinoplanes philippinensis TaxID=35752 RepID=UPI0033E8261C
MQRHADEVLRAVLGVVIGAEGVAVGAVIVWRRAAGGRSRRPGHGVIPLPTVDKNGIGITVTKVGTP